MKTELTGQQLDALKFYIPRRIKEEKRKRGLTLEAIGLKMQGSTKAKYPKGEVSQAMNAGQNVTSPKILSGVARLCHEGRFSLMVETAVEEYEAERRKPPPPPPLSEHRTWEKSLSIAQRKASHPPAVWEQVGALRIALDDETIDPSWLAGLANHIGPVVPR